MVTLKLKPVHVVELCSLLQEEIELYGPGFFYEERLTNELLVEIHAKAASALTFLSAENKIWLTAAQCYAFVICFPTGCIRQTKLTENLSHQILHIINQTIIKSKKT